MPPGCWPSPPRRSSDQAGRKPVLAAALGLSALSTAVFVLAPDLGALLAARIMSGLSAGLMTGTATAALTELVPAPAGRRASLVATAANMGGLGLGPLIAGLFSLVRAPPHHAGVRGVPGGARGRGPVPAVHPRNGQPATAARFAPDRPGHPRAEPGRVHRRGRGRVRRLLPTRAVRRAGAHLPRERAARGQPRRPGCRGVPALRGGNRHPAPALPLPQPPGHGGRPGPAAARALPVRRAPPRPRWRCSWPGQS